MIRNASSSRLVPVSNKQNVAALRCGNERLRFSTEKARERS